MEDRDITVVTLNDGIWKRLLTPKRIGVLLVIVLVVGSLLFGFHYKTKYEKTMELLSKAQGSEMVLSIQESIEAMETALNKVKIAEDRAAELEVQVDKLVAGNDRIGVLLQAAAKNASQARTGTDMARIALNGIADAVDILEGKK